VYAALVALGIERGALRERFARYEARFDLRAGR
jgi:hypothetical protein